MSGGMNSNMSKILAFMVGMVLACSCSSRSAEISAERTGIPEAAATSAEPTGTRRRRVSCPQDEVDAYLDELELVLEEWDDTRLRAGSTSRMSLSPVIGELQDIRRRTRRIDRPACAGYLNDLVVVAMERDIDSFISFLGQDSDSVVARKMDGAEKAWEVVEGEIANFEENPLEAYQGFSLTTEELEAALDEVAEFERPEGWTDEDIPDSDLRLSIPDDWSARVYGSEDEYLALDNADETVTFLVGSMGEGGLAELESDSGRLFSLQTILETSDYDYYLERSANVELHAENRAYVVEFSVRETAGDDIEDRIWAAAITPSDKEVMVMAHTTRPEFAQIDLATYKTVLGSIR
jgi:hypothetical protein